MTDRIAKTYCVDVTDTGRGCRAVARWTLPRDPRFFCKTHATRRALIDPYDGRIVNTLTGRVEIPAPEPPKPRTGPLPVGKEAIVAELATAATDADIDRARKAILAELDQHATPRGIDRDLAQALHGARARVKALKGRQPYVRT